jgi:hypothetical protein
MAELDRSVFIALLNRLGSADDQEALAAARELHATVTENGVTWDSLLIPDSGPAEAGDDEDEAGEDGDAAPESEDADDEEEEEEEADEEKEDEEGEEEEEDEEDGDEEDEDDDEEDEDEDEDEDEELEDSDGDEAEGERPAAEAGASSAQADAAEDKRLLERLLARKSLSQETRDDLAEYQRDLEKGKLSSMDRRYIRALAKRMGL